METYFQQKTSSYQDLEESLGKRKWVFESNTLSSRNSVFVAHKEGDPMSSVVVKVIHNAVVSEINVLKKLDHPNIVRFVESFQSDKTLTHFLLMEYESEGSLKDKMYDFGGVLMEKDALKIMSNVAQALNYLHNLGFVHNDVKPENIVLSSENVAKLCDFEYAHKEDEDQTRIKGTPMYYAPETVRLLEIYGKSVFRVTKTVDVWAFGVTFYKITQNLFPFLPFGGKAIDLYENILRENYHPCRYPLSSKGLFILTKCFIKEAENRITMNELVKQF